MPTAHIESLDHEGQGVAHVEGKTIFIDGALPGEVVEYVSYRNKSNFAKAVATQILQPSHLRVTPACPHFGVCGGCVMQHLEAGAQLAVKQRTLEDALWHIARLRAQEIYSPIAGEAWAYRQRARFSVRLVPRKGGVLVGFHEKRSRYIADMMSCAVLPKRVSQLLIPLRTTIASLSIASRVPQVELAVADAQIVLVLRVLDAPTLDDQDKLMAFAKAYDVCLYLQPGGVETAALFYPADAAPLSYALPDFNVQLQFSPTEFTQVNFGVNRMLVRRALALLQPQDGDTIADLFCGLGNFSLPIARSGARVLGIEGSAALTARAEANARLNGLAEQCQFMTANLFDPAAIPLEALGAMDKILIDPPREGAVEVVRALKNTAAKRVVYVSCNPATLARDAAILVFNQGYTLRGAGIAAMFPHTAHVESIAIFER